MKIYNNDSTILIDVPVDDNSYRHREIMGDNSLTLYFSLAEHLEIPLGAYVEFEGERYSLNRPEALKMQHSRFFEYTVTFESGQARAKIWKFRNTVDGRLKFSLTAKPQEHLQMFVDNMNIRDNGWKVGIYIDSAEKCINYDHAYCWDALGQMAEEFDTEFEIVGKTVSLHKVEYNKATPLPLSYGKGNGFVSGVGRSNYNDTPPIEILYAQGGTDNIDASEYGSSELHLPKNGTLKYDGEKFEDENGFDESKARTYIADDNGFSIRRLDKTLSTLAEDSLDCTEIYPKHVGVVSEVVCVDAENNFYDIIDSSIPDTLNYEDCLIEGETMTIIFQSGMLSGKEFEVKYYHEAKDTKEGKKKGRRFEIVPQEIDGQTMPNKAFCPKDGNSYAVFHCMLPEAYINAYKTDSDPKTGAEWDMMRQCVRHLYDNEGENFTFTGTLDGIWAKRDWDNIGGKILLGGYVLFTDARFQKEGALIRIIGIKDYINRLHSPELELSNSTVTGSFGTTLQTLTSSEVIAEDYHRDALQFTKRRFRDAKETLSMLEQALLDNFTNSVTPISVQTMAMLVGDESLQFRFVSSNTNPVQVAHSIRWDSEQKQLTAEAGIIQHMTLGISSLSSSHETSEYRFWDVEEYMSGRIEEGEKKFYLYAKVSETGQTGSFLLSETAIKMGQVSGYCHLLVGILNSEYDGERSFVPLYGFTEILPGRITTDKIVSSEGNSYFDLVANAMKLGDVLDFNSEGDGKLRLKGTIIQSLSGDSNYIGCFRGTYNSAITYYQGDEATYTVNGCTSTYRYINSTATKGNAPTNATYWKIIAQGVKGSDGIAPRTLYMNSDSEPATPTVENPAGWKAAPKKASPATEVDNMSDFSTETLASYGFVEVVEDDSSIAFKSDNYHIHSSSAKAKIKFTVNDDCTISFSWSISSESNYDKGSIYAIDDASVKVVNAVSGSKSGTYTADVKEGEHYIIVEYIKDGSSNVGNDIFIVKPTIVRISKAAVSKQVWVIVEKLNDGVFAGWSAPITYNGIDGKNSIILKCANSYSTEEMNEWITAGATYTFTVLAVDGAEVGMGMTLVVDDTTTGGYREYYGIITSVITSSKRVGFVCKGYSDNGAKGEPGDPGDNGKNSIILKCANSYSTEEMNEWITAGATYTFTVLAVDGAEVGMGMTLVVDDTTTGGYREYYGIITSVITSSKRVGFVCKGYSDNGARGESPVIYEADFDTASYIVDKNGEIKNTLTINFYKVVGNSRTAHSIKEVYASGYYPDGGLGYNQCNWNNNESQIVDSPEISHYCDDATETYKDYAYIRYDVTFVDGVVKQYVIPLVQEGQQGPQGPQGPQGASGVSVVVQYSTNATSWHSTFATGDKWMRTRMSNSSTWSSPIKIVGENGTNGSYMDYRFAISNVSETGSSTIEPTISGNWSDAPVPTTADYPYLWMRTQMMEWIASGNAYVGGTKYYTRLTGEKGEDGDYVEMRFAKNGSPTIAPALEETMVEPDGWSISIPSIGLAEYLWMTKCVKTASGIMNTNWSTPVRISGVKGDKGDKGDSPAMVFRGDYSESASYYGTAVRLDCVRYNESYYIARIDAGMFSGIMPTDTGKWNAFGATFDSVATQLLLAENANIAGWIFRNGRLESEACDKDGNPMAFLNGKTGDMRLKGVVQLSTAYSGNISDSNIFYLPSMASGVKNLSMGYELEDIGKVVRFYNSSPIGGGIYQIQGNTFSIENNISTTNNNYYAICAPQEVIEMTCFERVGSTESKRLAEWVLTGRFGCDNFKNASATGRFPRALAIGVLYGSSDTPYFSGYMWNGKTIASVFTVTKNGTGDYSVKFASGTLPSGYYVFFTGRDGNLKGSVLNQTSTGFDVRISDDSTLNNGDVNFMVLDPNWFYDF